MATFVLVPGVDTGPMPGGMAALDFYPPDARQNMRAQVTEQAHQLAASGNPVFAEMSGLDVVHLPTGHWPMFSRPADLAALLNQISAASTAE